MQKQITVQKCTTTKGSRLTSFFVRFAEVSQTFSLEKKGYGQRKPKKEKENTCDRNEKRRREKRRQQMNKCMSKKT